MAFKQSDIWIDGSCALCGSGPYHNLDRFSDHMVEHTNLRKIHEAIANKTGTVVCNQCKKPFNNVPRSGRTGVSRSRARRGRETRAGGDGLEASRRLL